MISVIIPVYNVENYLRQCVDSVLSQTYKDIEVILVSDVSKDNSVEICREYAEKDERIIHIEQTVSAGLGGARNAGISAASGEYILFVDSDDWIDVFALNRLLQAAEYYNTDVVLFADYYYENGMDKCFNHYDWTNNIGLCELDDIKTYALHSTAWSKLYKTSFLKENQLQFIEKSYYEDNSWGLLVYLSAKKIAVLNDKLYYYRRSDFSNSVYSRADFLGWANDYYFALEELKKREIVPPKAFYVLYFINFIDFMHKNKKQYRKTYYEKIRSIMKTWNLEFDDLFLTKKPNEELKKYWDEYKLIKCLPFAMYEFLHKVSKIIDLKIYKRYCIVELLKIFGFIGGFKIKAGKLFQLDVIIGRNRNSFR